MKKIALIISTFMISSIAFAQTGGIETIEATGSVSPIILDHVVKQNDIAKTKDTVLPPPAFTYPVQSKKFNTVVGIDTIKAAKLGPEPLNKLYRTYARMGVGNYSTFLGEFGVSSLRSKSGAWGVYGKHLNAGSGPKDVAGEFAGFSKQNVTVFGKTFLKRHTLYGAFDYDRNAVYNYGTASDTAFFRKETTRTRYNCYTAHADIRSHYTDSSMINHRVVFAYYHLNDLTKTNEDNFLVDLNAGRYIRTEHLGVNLGVNYNHNNSTSDTAVSTIIRFVPSFSTHGKKFDAAVGFGLFIDVNETNLTYFFPQASVSYDIVNHIIVPYLQLSSAMDRNSYRSLTDENPYMKASEAFKMKTSLTKYDLTIGLKGSLSSELSYDVHASRAEITNMPFFINTTEAQDIYRNKFVVVYDNVDRVNVHGQLAWRHLDKIQVTATGDWYKYVMANELHPWHTPTLQLNLIGEYDLADKIIAKVNVYYLNGQYSKISTEPMKGLVDVNLGLEYRYSKFLSGFINLNNIANQRYERWYGYPTQKFNFLAGLTYTF